MSNFVFFDDHLAGCFFFWSCYWVFTWVKATPKVHFFKLRPNKVWPNQGQTYPNYAAIPAINPDFGYWLKKQSQSKSFTVSQYRNYDHTNSFMVNHDFGYRPTIWFHHDSVLPKVVWYTWYYQECGHVMKCWCMSQTWVLYSGYPIISIFHDIWFYPLEV